jgi:heat-inducible transcriptional repressor
MAELVELGYLLQPHTSAGRVPTEKGYRFYVNSLISSDRSQWSDPVRLKESHLAGKREDMKELLQETSRLLSLLSHYAGIVMAPHLSNTLFKRLEFVRIHRAHVLVILVTQDGLIQNRIIDVAEDLQQEDLDRIASYLNEQFSGLDLAEVRRRLLHQMAEEKRLYDRLLAKAVELGQMALSFPDRAELFLGGTENILNLPEFADLEKMKSLFRAFEEKALIVQLLNKCLDSDGVQVFIGSENDNRAMENFSLVVSNYKRGNRTLGTLGVIGPTRMEYERVIPLVDRTAKLLTHLLEQD